MSLRKRSRFIGLLKPVSVAVLLFLIFAIVWLRSSVVSLEYSLSNFEKKRMELMRDKKILVAEQANLLYVGRLQNVAVDGSGLAFPDRVKVIYVAKAKDEEALRTSLRIGHTIAEGR